MVALAHYYFLNPRKLPCVSIKITFDLRCSPTRSLDGNVLVVSALVWLSRLLVGIFQVNTAFNYNF